MYMDGIHLKDIYNLYLLFGEYKLNSYHIHPIIISKEVNPSLNLTLNILSIIIIKNIIFLQRYGWVGLRVITKIMMAKGMIGNHNEYIS